VQGVQVEVEFSVVSLRGGKTEAVASVERPGLKDFNPLEVVED
jgi:hypothetical protein